MMKINMTRGSEFFKWLYIKCIPYQTNKYWFSFSFSFENAKFTIQGQFKLDTSIMAYQQNDSNSCSASILASALNEPNNVSA